MDGENGYYIEMFGGEIYEFATAEEALEEIERLQELGIDIEDFGPISG